MAMIDPDFAPKDQTSGDPAGTRAAWSDVLNIR
jgi:hypothetical protein